MLGIKGGVEKKVLHFMSCVQLGRVRSVAHAETRAIREHARSNVHGHELLEEQLRRVRDLDLRDALLVMAGAAFVQALLDLSGYGVSLQISSVSDGIG